MHRRRLICLGERAFLLWGRCSCEVWDGARLSGTFADGEGRGRRRAQTVLFCSFPHDPRVGAGRLSGVFCTYAADVMSYSALLLPANYFKSTLSFLEGSLT